MSERHNIAVYKLDSGRYYKLQPVEVLGGLDEDGNTKVRRLFDGTIAWVRPANLIYPHDEVIDARSEFGQCYPASNQRTQKIQ